MMKKGLKYTTGIVILLMVAYHSVYFKKLDEVKASASRSFDAKLYARTFFTGRLTPALNSAIELNRLLALVHTDKENAFNKYAHALGIGNIRFFLVRGQGEVTGINENDVTIWSKTATASHACTIATEFIYGNAIRDASGLIDINAFSNTMDFNNVSAEINTIIRTEVLPPFKQAVKKGDSIRFYGAIELNREHVDTENVEVIPIALTIIPGR